MKQKDCTQKEYDELMHKNKVDDDTLYTIKDLTWDELKEKAKEMGYCEINSCVEQDGKIVSNKSITNGKIQFFDNGMTLCEHLDYDQMLSIMKVDKCL